MARAEAAGAVAAVAIDAKEEFAEHYCLPALMANALYEDKYPLEHGHRPAPDRQEAGRDRPQVRRHGRRPRLHRQGQRPGAHRHRRARPGPEPQIVAPAPAPPTGPAARSCSTTCAAARHPRATSPRRAPTRSTRTCGAAATSAACSRTPGWRRLRTPSSSSRACRTRPTSRSTWWSSFEQGKPVALDGVAMGMVELIEAIDAIGNAHGFGRVDMIENRLVGIKSREVYEVAGLAGPDHARTASSKTWCSPATCCTSSAPSRPSSPT